MIRKIPTLAAFALVVIGCSRSAKVERGQQQYDVVQEGSASGVTSTINGPGETTPPITNTNADTTTNFTIPTNPNPLGNDTAGTALSGSVPAPITTTAMTSTASPRPLRPRVYTPPPRPQELRPEPATDTTMTKTDTDTATTTTDTTTTSPKTTTSSNPKKKSDEEQPPPPPTDTRG